MIFRLLPVVILLVACGGGSGDDPSVTDAGVDALVLPPAVGSFPAGFQWGTAISPYQVEKGLTNTDWYQWEQICINCEKGDHAEDGPDFLAHHDADLARARALGTNAIRLGVEWARIFPTRESFPASPDPTALAAYHAVLASAKAHGLSPMVTLHHFSTPSWLVDLARAEPQGWELEDTAGLFAEWARFCAREFGAEVDWWITINEPFAYVTAGWLGGVFPPGKLGAIALGFEVSANLIRGHALAYDAIHAEDLVDADGDGEAAWVSISTHNRVFLPRGPADAAATDVLRRINNLLFLDALVDGNIDWTFDGDFDDAADVKEDASLAGRMDFIGLNYYGVTIVLDGGEALYPFAVPAMNDLHRFGLDHAVTDFGWAVYPEGFRVVLDEVRPYGLPIVITENGLADADDDQRPRFLAEHLYAVAQAIDDGLDIRGYYHWSLMDNFEWAGGYCPRFGLYHIDFADPARPRTIGEGAEVYREIIEAGTVPVDLFRRYPSYPRPGLECTRTGP